MRWPRHPPSEEGADLGPIFLALNRNKRSVLLDLKTEFGREALSKLVATTDLSTTNIRLDVLERLGIGYKQLRSHKPDLIYVHAAGYGRGGPYEDLPAYDDIIQAQSGFADMPSRVDQDPTLRYSPSVIADKAAGLFMAYSTMAALFHHQRTGEGQLVEVPMFECLTSFLLVEHLFDQTFDPPTGEWAYSRIVSPDRRPYLTGDGYLALLSHSNQNWRDFFALTGVPETIVNDPRIQSYELRSKNNPWVQSIIEPLLVSRSSAEWEPLFRAHGIPCAKVNRLEDLKADPHLAAVDFVERRHHPDVGDYFAVKPPVSFSKTPASIRSDAPHLWRTYRRNTGGNWRAPSRMIASCRIVRAESATGIRVKAPPMLCSRSRNSEVFIVDRHRPVMHRKQRG